MVKLARIYKIYSEKGNVCFIGGTFQTLEDRLQKLTHNYNDCCRGKGLYTKAFEVLKYDDVKIETIKYLLCENTLKEVKDDIQKLIDETDCVNKLDKYRNQDMFQSQYVKCSCGYEVRRLYLKRHMETKKHKQGYIDPNKKRRDRYNKIINECSCGKFVKKYYMNNHIKTKYHLANA